MTNPIWAIDRDALSRIRNEHPEMASAARTTLALHGFESFDSFRSRDLEFPVVNGVVRIDLRGVMTKDVSFWTYISNGLSTTQLTDAFSQFASNTSIEAVLFVIDSPGGSVDGLDALGDAITACRKKKPVVAQVDGMAASAAYYAASQATEIHANRMDLVGSIGTYIMLYDYSKMFEEAGVKVIAVKTGEHKAAGAAGTEITDEQVAEFQRLVDAYFGDFKDAVLRGRKGKIKPKQLDGVADGRVFLADESVDLGLIDGVRKTRDAMEMVRPPRARVRGESFERERRARQLRMRSH